MIEPLPRVVAEAPDRPELAGPDHPIRKVTRQIAFEPDAWTPERSGKVAALFDAMASEWHARVREGHERVIDDALERGGVGGGLCLEVGSGTGAATPRLTEYFDGIVAVDLSMEMLRHASVNQGRQACADAASLPLAADAAHAIMHVNAFLFPSEVDRVLAPGGSVIWVSTLGDRTPIYLSAEDVAAALPGEWSGRASQAGWGSWCVLSRA